MTALAFGFNGGGMQGSAQLGADDQVFEFLEYLRGNSQVARCSGIHPPARSMSDG